MPLAGVLIMDSVFALASQLLSNGAGNIALALILYLFYLLLKKVIPVMIESQKDITETIQMMHKSMIEHDSRTEKIESRVDNIEQKVDQTHDKVIRIETMIESKKD